MTSETRHAPPSAARHSESLAGEGDATARSGKMKTPAPAAAVSRGTVSRVAAVIPYLAVLACVAVGLYVSWHQGSRSGQGGVIAGSALLVAAGIRLVLPAKLAGLLATRHRVTDVLTLIAFGTGLLIAGLVLPRLGPLSAKGRMVGPR
jgi:hypothetical protein